MTTLARRLERLCHEAGFSIAEVIAAAAVMSIAVVGLLSTMSLGFAGMDLGRLQSTAVLLAEQRLEEARAFAASGSASQGYANLTTAAFPAEAYGTIANAPHHRRTVAVVDQPSGLLDTKRIDVAVFYRPQTERGLAGESSVLVSTLVARR